MLKIDTDRLSVGLKMAVADVLGDQNNQTCQEGTEITEIFEPQLLSTK